MSLDIHPGVNIVSIGGGTGLSTLLSGLKLHTGQEAIIGPGPGPRGRSSGSLEGGRGALPWIETLTAVVTVTDDGGSSGRLREEFQILPPGDIRNCMAALAEDELLLTKLFQYGLNLMATCPGTALGISSWQL